MDGLPWLLGPLKILCLYLDSAAFKFALAPTPLPPPQTTTTTTITGEHAASTGAAAPVNNTYHRISIKCDCDLCNEYRPAIFDATKLGALTAKSRKLCRPSGAHPRRGGVVEPAQQADRKVGLGKPVLPPLSPFPLAFFQLPIKPTLPRGHKRSFLVFLLDISFLPMCIHASPFSFILRCRVQ